VIGSGVVLGCGGLVGDGRDLDLAGGDGLYGVHQGVGDQQVVDEFLPAAVHPGETLTFR
jgi:hypothetical protein